MDIEVGRRKDDGADYFPSMKNRPPRCLQEPVSEARRRSLGVAERAHSVRDPSTGSRVSAPLHGQLQLHLSGGGSAFRRRRLVGGALV